MTKQEFENQRSVWKYEWYNHWRLLDIDFEAYMLMKGLSKEEYNKLNSELWQNT
jgi:hypothetical protein